MFKQKDDLCGFDKEPCIKHRCHHWQHMLGKHPQTGAELDQWDCVFNLQTIIMLNVGKQVNDLGASIDSFRNEQSLNTLGGIAQILDDRQQKRLERKE